MNIRIWMEVHIHNRQFFTLNIIYFQETFSFLSHFGRKIIYYIQGQNYRTSLVRKLELSHT